MKVLIGKSLIKRLLNVQRALNLSRSTSNCYIASYQLTLFLKKVGLRDDDKCTFCHKEIENLIHLFWRCKKTKEFWDSLFKWLKSSQFSLSEINYLHINTALGLRPDSSKHKLQINFCCLTAKYYIWLCRLKEKKRYREQPLLPKYRGCKATKMATNRCHYLSLYIA